jgi:hypothetical protein
MHLGTFTKSTIVDGGHYYKQPTIYIGHIKETEKEHKKHKTTLHAMVLPPPKIPHSYFVTTWVTTLQFL